MLRITRRRRVYCVSAMEREESKHFYSPMTPSTHAVCYEDAKVDVVDRELAGDEHLDEILLILCTESDLLVFPLKKD